MSYHIVMILTHCFRGGNQCLTFHLELYRPGPVLPGLVLDQAGVVPILLPRHVDQLRPQGLGPVDNTRTVSIKEAEE